jgi:hypothetical protein
MKTIDSLILIKYIAKKKKKEDALFIALLICTNMLSFFSEIFSILLNVFSKFSILIKYSGSNSYV